MDGGEVVLANCPYSTRYSDGSYKLKARIEDIRGGYFEAPKTPSGLLIPYEFNLDNFKPFIQSVNVHIGTTEVYDMQWICESSCDGIRPEGGIIASVIDPLDFILPMQVVVKCSEPMYSLDMGVTVYEDEIDENDISYEVSPDRQTWTFSVQLPLFAVGEPTPISTGSDIAFSFTGLDYPVNVGDNASANPLLNLEDYYHPDDTQNNTSCLEVPIRMNALNNEDTWSSTLPEGVEVAHHFGLNCLSDDNIAGDGSEKKQIKLFNGFCCSEEFLAELSNSTTIELSPPCFCEGETLSPFIINTNTLLGPFTYKWSGPNEYESYYQNPDDIIATGDYSVSITNEDGCRIIKQINIPACIPIQDPAINANIICSEGGLSTIYINLPDTEGLTYEWSNGATTQNLENVSAGSYSVTVHYATGCELVLEAEVINAYDETFSSAIEAQTSCICSEPEPIQAFSLTVDGQNAPFTFLWSGPNGYTSTQQNPLLSESGDYSVTITNALGCEQVESINIPSCSSFSTSIITSPSCSGQATGEARVYADSDYPPFTFEWSNGATSNNLINLTEGIYSVTITDQKGCQTIETSEVDTHPLISILNPSVLTDCSGEGQASITPFITSGAAPFSYLWSNGQTTANATNLTSGDYTLTITDNQECSQAFDFVLTVGQYPIISATLTDAHCENNDGGVILDIQPAGSYTIQWPDGLMPNQAFRDDLSTGNYIVIVGSMQGCFSIENFTINEIEDEAGDLTVTETSTQDECNGVIEVSLGSHPPYTVELYNPDGDWVATIGGATGSAVFENLCAAERSPYTLIITDINSCDTEYTTKLLVCSIKINLIEYIRPEKTNNSTGSLTIVIDWCLWLEYFCFE